jgi:DNA segregation ATPase FtsK/SpoIIIE-like protein
MNRGNQREIRKQTRIGAGNFFVGFLFFCVFMVFAVSLVFYDPDKVCCFTFAAYEGNLHFIDNTIALLSDVLIQFTGLFSYFLTIVTFIWGWCFFSGKISEIKHKFCVLISFILLGCVVFNIASTNSFFENIIRRFGINCYAGGAIGYSLSKIIFLDILNHSEHCKWFFVGLLIIWMYVVKKTMFVNLNTIPHCFHVVFERLLRVFILKVKSNINESETMWRDTGDCKVVDNNEEVPTDPFITEPQSETSIDNFMGMIAGGGDYALPEVALLDKHNQLELIKDDKKIALLAKDLCNVLEEFGVKGEILNVRQGPVVTMFEFRPSPGIKTSRVISLSDDIARSMSALSARISTIPGKNAIGIELPNSNRQTVYLVDLLVSEAFRNFTTGIPLVLGKDISGNPIVADLSKMPHLLVAGTTGSGKSVSINDMVLSILFKFSPKDCKLIMIDPKMLELSVYDDIPHLLTPVVTDPKKAIFALKWAVSEMENRYRMMSKLGVRNIDGFNKKLKDAREKGDMLVRQVQIGFDQETGRPIFETQQLDFELMPYIVVIVDEMADLMLVAGKEVESTIQRLAQMARAAGIHLIMATQRPSVDVITGTIKANFPTRISFQVTSKIDSRTILGEQGAEQLLGQGDMLYMSGAGRILRVHGPFVKDVEVERVVSYIKGQCDPDYVDIIGNQFQDDLKNIDSDNQKKDEMYQKASDIVLNDKKVSTSYLQRKLQIGYNRAARIIDELEANGIISAPDHTGKRKIL